MGLNSNLPGVVGLITRMIFYGMGLVIVLGLLVYKAGGGLAGNTIQCIEEADKKSLSALVSAKAMDACLARRNGPIEKWLMRSTHKVMQAMPNAPCSYVGIWKSSRPSQPPMEISLRGNSEFSARPMGSDQDPEIIAGSWGIHENRMVWLYKEGHVWPPDINRMESVNPNSFTLVEMNGERTSFFRVDALPPGPCAK